MARSLTLVAKEVVHIIGGDPSFITAALPEISLQDGDRITSVVAKVDSLGGIGYDGLQPGDKLWYNPWNFYVNADMVANHAWDPSNGTFTFTPKDPLPVTNNSGTGTSQIPGRLIQCIQFSAENAGNFGARRVSVLVTYEPSGGGNPATLTLATPITVTVKNDVNSLSTRDVALISTTTVFGVLMIAFLLMWLFKVPSFINH